MRDDFNDRLQKATANQHIPTEAEIFQNELRKRSKIIDDLRKKNSNLMEQSRDEAISKESQQAKDFLNYRKTATETGAGGCCQLKVKWKRSAESHSEESLYRMFKAFGTVEDAVLVAGKGTSGLVTFTDPVSAMKAYDFYRNSEEYRVSLLSADGTNYSSAPPLRTTATPQSELASDIRRAMEKSNLIDVINQLKRPSTDNLAASAGAETTVPGVAAGANASVSAQGTAVPAAKPAVTAASLASKESEILARMMEVAAKKKQAALDAQNNSTGNITAP
jgi:hypothetical protein